MTKPIFFSIIVLSAALAVPFLISMAGNSVDRSTKASPLSPHIEIGELSPMHPTRAGFSLRFKDEMTSYRVMGVFVMPGESVNLDVLSSESDDFHAIEADAGLVTARALGSWVWKAPYEPGVYTIDVTDTQTGDHIRLNAFVKVPFDHSGEYLNGYRIGKYAPRALNGDTAFERPQGFIEVTSQTEDILVAPNFTLGQFLCKQAGDYPKYLVLSERLVIKLQTLLDEVNTRGFNAATFHVMSAFRTPDYNRAIGNTTTYSQHLYGGAADIFIDTSGDTWMDDLTGSGNVTVEDARLLAGIVEEMAARDPHTTFEGGLGIYEPAEDRGPFIHVDVRGHRARW